MSELTEAQMYDLHHRYTTSCSCNCKLLLAEHLFREHNLSPTRAAKMVGLKRKDLMKFLGEQSPSTLRSRPTEQDAGLWNQK